MNTSRPLDASVCDVAWQITVAAIEKAALMGRCQLRGAVAVVDLRSSTLIFSADINPQVDDYLPKRFRHIAIENAHIGYGGLTSTVLTGDPEKYPEAARLTVSSETATVGTLCVSVAMADIDQPMAQMAASTMLAAIMLEQSVELDRRPPAEEDVDLVPQEEPGTW